MSESQERMINHLQAFLADTGRVWVDEDDIWHKRSNDNAILVSTDKGATWFPWMELGVSVEDIVAQTEARLIVEGDIPEMKLA